MACSASAAQPSLAELTTTARAEWTSCFTFAQGKPAASADGLDGHVNAFLDAASQLQQGFAHALRREPGTSDTAAQLRRDIEALQSEQREKGELIARHRERLERWSGECRDIQAAQRAELALSEPKADQ